MICFFCFADRIIQFRPSDDEHLVLETRRGMKQTHRKTKILCIKLVNYYDKKKYMICALNHRAFALNDEQLISTLIHVTARRSVVLRLQSHA